MALVLPVLFVADNVEEMKNVGFVLCLLSKNTSFTYEVPKCLRMTIQTLLDLLASNFKSSLFLGRRLFLAKSLRELD